MGINMSATLFQAVLFDMDGTLLDTLEDIAESMNRVLVLNGLPTHPVDQYRRFVGSGIEKLARDVLPYAYRNAERVRELSEQMRVEYSQRWHEKTRLYPGVEQMLDGLHERGIRLGILSNKPDEFTKIIFEYFLSPWNFEMVLGASAERPTKPDPTAALFIAKKMGIEPRQFVYLGDSDTDMKTAIAAEMYPVGALWGFRDAKELRENGAKVLLQRPEDLLNLISSPPTSHD
jgi:phosphoglycolate phosphatase